MRFASNVLIVVKIVLFADRAERILLVGSWEKLKDKIKSTIWLFFSHASLTIDWKCICYCWRFALRAFFSVPRTKAFVKYLLSKLY